MSDQPPAFHTWLAAPLETAVRQALQRICRADDVIHMAVMPDVHLATDVCVGTAMATRRLIYPGAVGGDIGCGMLALAFEASADLLTDPRRAGLILRDIASRVPPRRHHRSATVPLPPTSLPTDLSHGSLAAIARGEGALQFATLGGGNHFIEIQSDEEGCLWLMVHSGSRAMGQAIRDHHVARAAIRSAGMPALDSATDEGKAYLNDAHWARRFADASRRAMAQRVAEVLAQHGSGPPDQATLISIDHNHVQFEPHHGQTLLVHRKGAMPAETGAPGVIPGSMGTFSVHVLGRGNPDSLRSSAHGAGRKLSRHAARQRITKSDLRRQMQNVWFDARSQNLTEEAPRAYKDLRAVLTAQADLAQVTRRLRPLLVYKSG